MMIKNPVLRGFNPDPSICRAGDDYYIATSTFEWFPGVQINHSKDLVHWDLLGYPLTRVSQLNMIGEEDSCGVWAPCLSYDKGRFYLIYTDVKSFIGSFKDNSLGWSDLSTVSIMRTKYGYQINFPKPKISYRSYCYK